MPTFPANLAGKCQQAELDVWVVGHIISPLSCCSENLFFSGWRLSASPGPWRVSEVRDFPPLLFLPHGLQWRGSPAQLRERGACHVNAQAPAGDPRTRSHPTGLGPEWLLRAPYLEEPHACSNALLCHLEICNTPVTRGSMFSFYTGPVTEDQ